MKVNNEFVFFFTANDIFSNWHRSTFYHGGRLYQNGEQWMMHQKALLFEDVETAKLIINVRGGDPKECKALGRNIVGFSDEIWIANRENIVKNGIWLKARSNDKFYQELMYHHLSGRKFVEASKYDRIWGCGFDENAAEANRDKWGLNLLGKCLDDVALKLRATRDEHGDPFIVVC